MATTMLTTCFEILMCLYVSEMQYECSVQYVLRVQGVHQSLVSR
jgi:hypothetical protein